jgi:hypothetical protein
MSPRHESPSVLSSTPSGTSAEPSQSSLGTNPFSRMMNPTRESTPTVIVKDTCKRPEVQYNFNYNPLIAPSDTQPKGYSPYVYGEPMYDDREPLTARFPRHHVLSGASKRERTQWVWRVGYMVVDSTKASKPINKWMCKHCHHDTDFAKGKTWIYNADSLKNAANHMLLVHKLDEGGDL